MIEIKKFSIVTTIIIVMKTKSHQTHPSYELISVPPTRFINDHCMASAYELINDLFGS